MLKNKYVFIILFVAFSFSSFAQNWKKSKRWEFIFGIGVSNFLGDLGGADQVGTHFLRDLEISLTQPTINLALRYRILQYASIKTNLFYGTVEGDDKLTNEIYRRNRNLSFRSPIVELSSQFEAGLYKERSGSIYHIKGVRGRKYISRFLYGFAGIGVFYFNPKAKYNDSWYALQPLGTEGQGIAPNTKKYSLFSIAIPVGVGFKTALNKTWSIGLEFGVRKTFTDYIDDVSTDYYDKNAINSNYGELAVTLSDRSEGDHPNWTIPGEQRGDPKHKDAYMFATINFSYKFSFAKQLKPKFLR